MFKFCTLVVTEEAFMCSLELPEVSLAHYSHDFQEQLLVILGLLQLNPAYMLNAYHLYDFLKLCSLNI